MAFKHDHEDQFAIYSIPDGDCCCECIASLLVVLPDVAPETGFTMAKEDASIRHDVKEASDVRGGRMSLLPKQHITDEAFTISKFNTYVVGWQRDGFIYDL